MPFNSLEYLIFFLLVLLLSFVTLGLPKIRIWILLLASYYFYASNNHWLIVLILFSTQVDYFAAIFIENSNDISFRKKILLTSVCVNLGFLGFFKYFNFFSASVVDLMNFFNMKADWVDLNIILPVGISFYTFQSMSYTIDVFRGNIKAERSWLNFSLYVSYFPQLVAGPIVRAKNFLPALRQKNVLTPDAFEHSLSLIFFGLFKKLVIADFLSIYCDPVFSSPLSNNCFHAWIGVYAFSMQIYYDFSGYSDIAIGCAGLMGFKLPENFNNPYAASGLGDFWRRWHISLSAWLRDYLYIPLGGNRMGKKILVYRNIMITMLLGGLWHGAAWHFVVWGGLNGTGLIAERAWKNFFKEESNIIPLLIKQLITYNLVVLLWVFFRIENMDKLSDLTRVLFYPTQGSFVSCGSLLVLLIIIFSILYQVSNEYVRYKDRIRKFPVPVKAALYYASAVLAVVFSSIGSQPFIYFQF